MKTFCEMARINLSGSSRVSDGFVDKTTVTAPMMATKTPNTSLYSTPCSRLISKTLHSKLTLRNLSLSITGAKTQFAIKAN